MINKRKNEIMTKLNTIIEDPKTPTTYKAWLNQVIDFIQSKKRNEYGDWMFKSDDKKHLCQVSGDIPYKEAREIASKRFAEKRN